MRISSKAFRVREGDEVDLKKWPTKVEPVYKSKERYRELLKEHVSQLSLQQQLLYASNRYALLLIFQALDAAGKGDATKADGVQLQNSKLDFLRRTTCRTPTIN